MWLSGKATRAIGYYLPIMHQLHSHCRNSAPGKSYIPSPTTDSNIGQSEPPNTTDVDWQCTKRIGLPSRHAGLPIVVNWTIPSLNDWQYKQQVQQLSLLKGILTDTEVKVAAPYTNQKAQRGGTSNGRGQALVRLHRSAYTMAARKRGKQTIFRPAASSKKYEKKIIKNSENSWKSRKTQQRGC